MDDKRTGSLSLSKGVVSCVSANNREPHKGFQNRKVREVLLSCVPYNVRNCTGFLGCWRTHWPLEAKGEMLRKCCWDISGSELEISFFWKPRGSKVFPKCWEWESHQSYGHFLQILGRELPHFPQPLALWLGICSQRPSFHVPTHCNLSARETLIEKKNRLDRASLPC